MTWRQILARAASIDGNARRHVAAVEKAIDEGLGGAPSAATLREVHGGKSLDRPATVVLLDALDRAIRSPARASCDAATLASIRAVLRHLGDVVLTLVQMSMGLTPRLPVEARLERLEAAAGRDAPEPRPGAQCARCGYSPVKRRTDKDLGERTETISCPACGWIEETMLERRVDWPSRPEPAPAAAQGKVQIDWISIPGGSFQSGLTARQARRLAEISAGVMRRRPVDGMDEERELEERTGNADWVEARLLVLYPAASVELAPYKIARRPVTNAEYARFLAETGAERPYWWKQADNAEPQRPVTGLSWNAAVSYARWAGADLPTEAQWARAARGRDGRLFPWGDDWGPVGDRLEKLADPNLPWPPGTIPGLESPDGVLDLVTRRWEWCDDVFLPPPGAVEQAWRELHPAWREGMQTLRGGESAEIIASSVARRGWAPDKQMLDTGFRLALPG
jgi:formylglycine-generating enzyme required for sulfatase activity